MFENVIQKNIELPDWSYIGFICFPEIESREVFKANIPELTDEDLRSIITKHEVQYDTDNWIKDLSLIEYKTEPREDHYRNLTSLMVGSQYVSINDQRITLHDKTYKRLVGGAELHSEQPVLSTSENIGELRKKSLGDLPR